MAFRSISPATPAPAPMRRGWLTSEFAFSVVALCLGAGLLAFTKHEETAKWLMTAAIGGYTASRTVVKTAAALKSTEPKE